MLLRFVIYGLLGWAGEIFWTGLPKRLPIDWTLSGHTQWWTFPLYGSIAFFYEPLHDLLRSSPWLLRGLIYAAGFIMVELLAGLVLKAVIARVPWDYTGKTRWQIFGATRFDYLPLWFIVGLALEPVHDYLVLVTPVLLAATGIR